MKKVFVISIFLICVFFIGIVSFFASPEETKNNISINNQIQNNVIENNNIDENIITTTSEEITVSHTATLIINKYYKDCGHTITSSVDVPYDMINMNKEEIEENYSSWKIVNFSKNEISLYKEFDGICNEHYIVGIENGYIVVYNLNEDNERNLYKKTEISTEYLTEGDVRELEKEIEVQGFSNLNALLENYE